MKEFFAKDYKNRADLESAISLEIGTNIEKNRADENIVKGSEKDLKRMRLGNSVSIFGCRVVMTNYPKKDIINKKRK